MIQDVERHMSWRVKSKWTQVPLNVGTTKYIRSLGEYANKPREDGSIPTFYLGDEIVENIADKCDRTTLLLLLKFMAKESATERFSI